jgi:hypothetical protein
MAYIKLIVFQLFFSVCCFSFCWGQGSNIAAIIVSGYKGVAFEKDVEIFKAAVTNDNTGFGIPDNTTYIKTKHNASQTDIESFITQINNQSEIDTVIFYLTSHGFRDGVRLAGAD